MPFIPKQVYIDAEIEERPGPISVYRTANGGTSSRELRQGLLRRWERWREVFSIDGEATDLGDRIAFLGESTALEVYLASESVWWTDRTKAYREDPGEGGVPDDDQAVHLARRFIETTFAPAVDLTDVVVGEQVASVSTSPDAEPRSQRVAVAVTLRPVVSGRPVFGPGAKVRVSFADGAEPSDVAYFSRSLEPDGEAETLHPYQALERLRRDRRFTDVIAAGMELHVRRFQLGYYSAAPNMFQRYLIPVYLAEGVVEGSELDADLFRLYLPAVDMDARSMKEVSVRANPTVLSSFTSF